ncbi:MAG: S46 family peptidase [Dysgonomonas sp.]
MKKILFSIVSFLLTLSVSADEGMWVLKELNKQSAERMKELGFTFPIDSIYSEEKPSLKDAVVIFDQGCTGVAVSDKGLIFTNHHCGYDAIQKNSSVEHDYLKDGFVSQNTEEEIYTEGVTVSFLQKTEDVTDKVLEGITPETTEEARYAQIDSLSNEILKEYKDNEFLDARVIPYYGGNKYYLIVYEVFKDIRMVFAPPSSVGKFGGETDNWMWPRHTGDFSVFRVYGNKDNKAAAYSPDNVPYKPKYVVPVSLKGYDDKGYAMTIGYPGSTERYMSSWGITQMVESENKPRIEVRTAKQNIWKEAMNASDAVRIKYASKYARSSNYWKNSIGMNTAIAKLNVIPEKEKLEAEFNLWLDTNSSAKEKYSEALPSMKEGYEAMMESSKVMTYFYETFYSGMEIVRMSNTVLLNKQDTIEKKVAHIKDRLKDVYKDYEPELDKKVAATLLALYAEKVDAKYLPDIYRTIEKKHKGDYQKYVDWVYKNTNFTSLDKVIALVEKNNIKKLEKDPVIQLAKSINASYDMIVGELLPSYSKIDKGSRLFIAGLIEMQPDKAFYPDANFTQRLSYGSIGGYKPFDAAEYYYYSTSKGVLEKENPENPEFNVQQYILDDLRTKNWGQYADKDGSMHVNFLSNNDITGGNSGSPVFNGQAHLIGLAFDGNWEALSGDIVFEPEVQRTISVDIRYVLYMIDKVMKCPRLIQELNVVK